MSDAYGIQMEELRRKVTASRGLPYFVFQPAEIAKGSAQRELGDFFLWNGRDLVVVSHKARDPAAEARQSDSRHAKWLAKQSTKAASQIEGVVRALRDQTAAGGPARLVSEAGVEVPIRLEPSDKNVVGVVVLDSSQPEEDVGLEIGHRAVPTVTMLASDWDRLLRWLPSPSALIEYLHQRHTLIPRCPLGSELDVFAALIEHQNTGVDLTTIVSSLSRDNLTRTVTAQPEWFFGTAEEDRFAIVVWAMLDAVVDPDQEYSSTENPEDFIALLAVLDRIPLLHRAQLGRAIIETCQRASERESAQSKLARIPDGILTVLSGPEPRSDRAWAMRGLALLRHVQALEAGAPEEFQTVGVATESFPSPNGRSHDFVLLRGHQDIPLGLRRSLTESYGVFDFAPFQEAWNP